MRPVFWGLMLLPILAAGRSQGQMRGGASAHDAGSGGPALFRVGPAITQGRFTTFRHSRERQTATSSYYPFDCDEPYAEPQPEMAFPQVLLVHEQRAPQAPATPASPQVIEVHEKGLSAAAPRPQPPAVFVFANGERLEVRRYTLTERFLFIGAAGQERRIPIDILDLDATVAANRERGINLTVPTNRNEISLNF